MHSSSTVKNSDELVDLSETGRSGWEICLHYLLEEFAVASKKSKSFERVDDIKKM